MRALVPLELHALQAICQHPPPSGALQLPQLVAADSAQRLLLTKPVVKALGEREACQSTPGAMLQGDASDFMRPHLSASWLQLLSQHHRVMP